MSVAGKAWVRVRSGSWEVWLKMQSAWENTPGAGNAGWWWKLQSQRWLICFWEAASQWHSRSLSSSSSSSSTRLASVTTLTVCVEKEGRERRRPWGSKDLPVRWAGGRYGAWWRTGKCRHWNANPTLNSWSQQDVLQGFPRVSGWF